MYSTRHRRRPIPQKNQPTGIHANLNLVALTELFTDEIKACELLEKRRWPKGPFAHYNAKRAYTLKAQERSKNPAPPGVYKCDKRRKKFTVRIGTVFEERNSDGK
jgi:hypothetical protein